MPRGTVAIAALGVTIAVLSGAVVGAVVGGLGGRLAMRLTAAWTDGPPFTLTGAEAGEMTLGGALSLLGSTAQAGTIVGLLYAVVRSALPSSHRAGVFALPALLLPGGLILGDDELKHFEPPLLTAALFLPMFPVGGLALAAMVERLDVRPTTRWTPRRQFVVAAMALLGLGVMLRNLIELT